MKDKKKKDINQVQSALVMVIQFGLNAIVPILICTISGTMLANHFNAKWIAIVFIILGIVAAFNGAYRSVRGYLKNEESPGQRARRLEEETLKKGTHSDND